GVANRVRFHVECQGTGCICCPPYPQTIKGSEIRVFHSDRLNSVCCRYDSHPAPVIYLVCNGDTVDCTGRFLVEDGGEVTPPIWDVVTSPIECDVSNIYGSGRRHQNLEKNMS